MADILATLKHELSAIDKRLSDLTHVGKFTQFNNSSNRNNSNEDQNEDHELSSSSSTAFSSNQPSFKVNTGSSVVVRARRGRAQVLHALSSQRGSVLASPSLLYTIQHDHKTSFQSCKTSLHFVETLKSLLDDVQEEYLRQMEMNSSNSDQPQYQIQQQVRTALALPSLLPTLLLSLSLYIYIYIFPLFPPHPPLSPTTE